MTDGPAAGDPDAVRQLVHDLRGLLGVASMALATDDPEARAAGQRALREAIERIDQLARPPAD